MPTSRADLLRFPFDVTFALLEYHLERLETADLYFEPAARCWTVRPDGAGGWVPDWEEPEPDPPPLPTAAWVAWHLGWWWSVTDDHLSGRRLRERTEITWPGRDAEVVAAWLRDLGERWRATLDRLTDADLDAPAPFPWPTGPEHPSRTVAHTVSWVNAELMKNVAEIGQLRLLRAARHPAPDPAG